MISTEQKACFFRWLKENKIYCNFIINVKKGKDDFFNFFRYINVDYCDIEELIVEAFSWAESKEGDTFWEGVSVDWRYYVRENNIENF